MWTANAQAWRIYQALCGRMVGLCELHGLVIEKATEGWSVDQVTDLLRRLDVMLDILTPRSTETPRAHGRPENSD